MIQEEELKEVLEEVRSLKNFLIKLQYYEAGARSREIEVKLKNILGVEEESSEIDSRKVIQSQRLTPEQIQEKYYTPPKWTANVFKAEEVPIPEYTPHSPEKEPLRTSYESDKIDLLSDIKNWILTSEEVKNHILTVIRRKL